MATLVLSTVGNALGGPVGGAIGALIGQSIDEQLLGPSSRGPRLGDLKVQSSAYGTQIPRIYGSMRVAGSVIWATDLVESTQVSGAKGQPDSVYSYTVSLAVAVSSRAIRSIGRIWADGKLLRGAAGDLKVSTKFRIYGGDEDQQLDPLIASVEGIASTPAYRGLALAVFEDLELAEYGNRIPFLTFEVFADDGLCVGDVINDASAGIVNSSDDRSLIGFAAYGQHIKAAVEPLIDGLAVELLDDGSRLVSVDAPMLAIADEELGNSHDGRPAPRIRREQLPARSLPSVLRLGYYDAALDYQSGEARATSGERRGVEEQRELPAVVTAAAAKSIAQDMVAREWAERDKLTVHLGPRYLGLSPGSRVKLDLSPRSWRVEQCTIDGFVNIVELRPVSARGAAVAADSGRIIAESDVAAADAVLVLFDIPDVFQQDVRSSSLMLAASAASPGWKSRNVEIVAGPQRFETRTARRKTVLGYAVTVPEAGESYLINREGSFEIQLIDHDQWLASCDEDALRAGSNLAVLGSEVLQFGGAEPLGEGRWRLTRLLRGRAGTEWATGIHTVGEAFALIERDTLMAVELPSWSGPTVSASMRNLSGTVSVSVPAVTGSGKSVRPFSRQGAQEP